MKALLTGSVDSVDACAVRDEFTAFLAHPNLYSAVVATACLCCSAILLYELVHVAGSETA